MAAPTHVTNACVTAHTTGECLHLSLCGRWKVAEPRPSFESLIGLQKPETFSISMEDVETWDGALVLFLVEAKRWSAVHGIAADFSQIPRQVMEMADQIVQGEAVVRPADSTLDLVTGIGMATVDAWRKTKAISTFVGECVLSASRLLRQPARFRWADCLAEMQRCGAMALPIVSLISLLVGLIMAYQAAVQLRQFGADIFVADLVGLAVVREMGPMMAAIIMAGRTGAAFAATLGNMKAGEEIDALQTLGIDPVDFLVMPRLVALGVMMPLLALYANLLGILGGMAVAKGVLDIPPSAYWVETQSIIDLSDLSTGLIKATTFGLLIGLSGCLRGLQADRSASGVGSAATSAVVTSILLIIVADALFAVVFNILGL